MRIMSEILEKSDSKSKDVINSNVDKFVKVFIESRKIKGRRWDDILLRYEWIEGEGV